jgi:glycosyltransferase involved in cell wall biosynthesis
MLSGCDIVIISSIEWDFNWQGHQEIAKRFASAGNRILYIENLGVRSPGLNDARRVFSRVSNWAQALPNGIREVSTNLFVYSPLMLPPFGSKARQLVNRRVLLKLISRTVKKLNFKSEIIWTYLPTDTVVSLIKVLRKPESVVVYYCIADFTGLTPHAGAILDSELTVIEMSDVVFAQCQALAERWPESRHEVGIFPFGVNLDLFSPDDVRSLNNHSRNHFAENIDPDFMSRLPRPVIGYVGGVHKHFDAGLLIAMAKARPDWSWVLIGPLQIPPNYLARMSNVHLLGAKAHEDLPRYIRGFDVGIVPYVSNEYTMTVIPTKINEYLAMGKPVVSTDLREVIAFNDKHNVIITTPNRPAEFLSSIEKALHSTKEAHIVHRRKVAALSDWEDRLEQMSDTIERELNHKFAEKSAEDERVGLTVSENERARDRCGAAIRAGGGGSGAE